MCNSEPVRIRNLFPWPIFILFISSLVKHFISFYNHLHDILLCINQCIFYNSQKGLRSILSIETMENVMKFDLGFSNEPFLFSQSLDTVAVLYYVLLLCNLEPVEYNLLLIRPPLPLHQ